MRKIVAKNGITGLFAGKCFDIFLKNLRLEGKFFNQYQVIIDINVRELCNIYIYVNTLSYGQLSKMDMIYLENRGIGIDRYGCIGNEKWWENIQFMK